MKNRDYRNAIILEFACTLLLAGCGFYFGGILSGLLILLAGAAFALIFSFYTGKRYRDIEELDGYLTRVLAGEDVPEAGTQEEGELSILKSDIYKAATMLTYQKELLSEDKIRLSNAIADISHQLKTPLTSMMVMNDLLRSEEDPDKRQEFLFVQQAQLDRMNWLIHTLLKLSKIDAGTIEMKREEMPVRELTGEAVRPFEIQMELQEIRLVISCADVFVLCDRNWTVEALRNIIKNCLEHMDRGGTLGIAAEDTSLFVGISISDNGCGIAEEDLPHIFERFYKGKNAGENSVGIGLALSKSIVDGQHGEILVTSREGIGTRFEVRFYKTII